MASGGGGAPPLSEPATLAFEESGFVGGQTEGRLSSTRGGADAAPSGNPFLSGGNAAENPFTGAAAGGSGARDGGAADASGGGGFGGGQGGAFAGLVGSLATAAATGITGGDNERSGFLSGQQPSDGGGGGGGGGRGGSLFTPSGWARYFDFDTSDITQRVRMAAVTSTFTPLRPKFAEATVERPDLYGPFWICTTLVFLSAMAGNFAAYLKHTSDDSDWFVDIKKVALSAVLWYGYATVAPLVLYLYLRWHGAAPFLSQLACIYGYSLAIFVPTAVICVVPSHVVEWIAISVAGAQSTLFLVSNARDVVAGAPAAAARRSALVAVCAAHAGLAVGLKLYFFN